VDIKNSQYVRACRDRLL